MRTIDQREMHQSRRSCTINPEWAPQITSTQNTSRVRSLNYVVVIALLNFCSGTTGDSLRKCRFCVLNAKCTCTEVNVSFAAHKVEEAYAFIAQ